MTQTKYDVVIVGGGMVGATLACALNASPATQNLSVLIIDAQPQSDTSKAAPHPSFDSRSTALSAASRSILERAGLWHTLQASACPIDLSPAQLDGACELTDANRAGLVTLFDKLKVSARGAHRVLRVARTIADYDGSAEVTQAHYLEAAGYRRGGFEGVY